MQLHVQYHFNIVSFDSLMITQDIRTVVPIEISLYGIKLYFLVLLFL